MRNIYFILLILLTLLIKSLNNQIIDEDIDDFKEIIANNDTDVLLNQNEDENENDEQMFESATTVSTINKIKLNDYYKIMCPNTNVKLKFESMIFNSSIYNIETFALNLTDEDTNLIDQIKIVEINSNLYLNLKTNKLFNMLFGENVNKHILTDVYSIETAKYSDSGRYYCVYSLNDDDDDVEINHDLKEYFISSHLYLVYDGLINFIFKCSFLLKINFYFIKEEIILKNFNETIELDPLKEDDIEQNLDNIQWFYDDSSQNFDLYFSLNVSVKLCLSIRPFCKKNINLTLFLNRK